MEGVKQSFSFESTGMLFDWAEEAANELKLLIYPLIDKK